MERHLGGMVERMVLVRQRRLGLVGRRGGGEGRGSLARSGGHLPSLAVDAVRRGHVRLARGAATL